MKILLSVLIILGGLSLTIPCFAMDHDETESKLTSPPILQKVMGKSLEDLQKMKATVKYPLITSSIGNILTISDGELNIKCIAPESGASIFSLYEELNKAITTGIIFEGDVDIKSETKQRHIAQRCSGVSSLKLEAVTEFFGDQALFGSQGNIEFTASKFDFTSSFINVDPSKTVIKLYPHASLSSPIEYLEFIPKASTLIIQGKIDFSNLSFEDFIISHSEFVLKFKGQQ